MPTTEDDKETEVEECVNKFLREFAIVGNDGALNFVVDDDTVHLHRNVMSL